MNDLHPDRFSIQSDSDGSQFAIDNFTGNIVGEDINDQTFCDFITWMSFHPNINTSLQPFWMSHFFCDLKTLVDHLKSNDYLIHCHPGPSTEYSGQGRFDSNIGQYNITFNGKKYEFARLYCTRPISARQASRQLTLQRVDYADRTIPVPSRTFVTERLLEQLNIEVERDDSDFRKVSSLPTQKSFAYVDISDFSAQPAPHQALIIRSLITVVKETAAWKPPAEPNREISKPEGARNAIEAEICIGDGYIYVFNSPLKALYFSAYLAHAIEIYAAKGRFFANFHFRMGIHHGPVYTFWDPGRNDWNYIGDGINGGQRVLAAIGKDVDDVLFISDDVRRAIIDDPVGQAEYPEILGSLTNRGRREDKHKNKWRVYEVNHAQLMAPFSKHLIG